MQVKDIVILKSISPITELKDKPSKETLGLIQRILDLDIFSENKIQKYRQMLHIPKQGYNILDYQDQHFKDMEILENDFLYLLTVIATKSMFSKYNINGDILYLVILLLYFNAFVDLRFFSPFLDQKFEYIVGKKQIASRLFDYAEHEVIAILIPFNASYNKFDLWAKKIWKQMQTDGDSFVQKDNDILKASQNIQIAHEIGEMIKQGRTTAQIADLLTDKYPKDLRFTDTDNIKKIHARYLASQKILTDLLPIASLLSGTQNKLIPCP